MRAPVTNPSLQQTTMSAPPRSTTAEALGGRCRYCSGTLPTGRRLTFCPHCGQNLTVQHCPACNTELEVGWKFCTTCGRGVSGG
jgi:predicted amidophosphoribosyltransferase